MRDIIFTVCHDFFLTRMVASSIAPFVIGIILGPMTESNFRKSLMMFNGNVALIFGRPLATALLGVCLAFIADKIMLYIRQRRHVFKEADDG